MVDEYEIIRDLCLICDIQSILKGFLQLLQNSEEASGVIVEDLCTNTRKDLTGRL